ncbi:MAG: redox-sensing transcriptional repressor Rex, partial [Lachnospiraceae bacterium]|nr:redox-sensing transcriptional repressor Rex [Lachnospiraceae bacterium]
GAEMVAPILVENGVKAIWNFAHTDLQVPEDVVVENVHLSESLMQLSYDLNHRKVTEEE